MTENNETTAGVETAPAAQAPAAPQFVNAKKRFRTIKLEWPLNYNGQTYDAVTVHRMTGQEVADFIKASNDEVATARLPMFDVPVEVIDALDPDAVHATMRLTLISNTRPASATTTPGRTSSQPRAAVHVQALSGV